MVSNVQENASFNFFQTQILKNLPTPSHTLPSLGRFAPSHCPR